MGQPYLMFWSGFILVALFVGFLQWAVYSFLQMSWLPCEPVIGSVVLGGVLFPLMSLLMHLTHKLLPVSRINFSS